MEVFNKESVYDEQISPLMARIIEICNEHGIPMLCSFAYENTEDNEIGFCTSLINNIPDRECKQLQHAVRVIRDGGAAAFTTAITIVSAPTTTSAQD